jgi:chitosanase
MLDLVQQYNSSEPGNVLQQYTSTLQQLVASGSDDTSALGDSFPDDRRTAAADPEFVFLPLKVGHDTALTAGPGKNDCDGVYKITSETASQMSGNPASGVAETQWLATYNQIRQQHMKHPCTPGRQAGWRARSTGPRPSSSWPIRAIPT